MLAFFRGIKPYIKASEPGIDWDSLTTRLDLPPTREEAEQLIGWIRSGELKPVLHAAFKLSDLHRAEDYFVSRGNNFLGKIVIVPDRQWADFGEPFALKETT